MNTFLKVLMSSPVRPIFELVSGELHRELLLLDSFDDEWDKGMEELEEALEPGRGISTNFLVEE